MDISHALRGTVGAGAEVGFGLIMVLGLIVGLALYFLPTIVALSRRHPSTGFVIVINVFLGWTLFGWVWALARALDTKHRGDVTVNVVGPAGYQQPEVVTSPVAASGGPVTPVFASSTPASLPVHAFAPVTPAPPPPAIMPTTAAASSGVAAHGSSSHLATEEEAGQTVPVRTCVSCGAGAPADARFCMSCGSSIEDWGEDDAAHCLPGAEQVEAAPPRGPTEPPANATPEETMEFPPEATMEFPSSPSDVAERASIGIEPTVGRPEAVQDDAPRSASPSPVAVPGGGAAEPVAPGDPVDHGAGFEGPLADRMRQLAALRDDGSITEEEYRRLRRNALDHY